MVWYLGRIFFQGAWVAIFHGVAAKWRMSDPAKQNVNAFL